MPKTETKRDVEKLLYSRDDVMYMLSCSDRQIARWITERKITPVKLGGVRGSIWFTREEIDRFIAEHTGL